MNTSEVIVVGAGPTGLMLACELAMRGVAVRLLEERRDLPNITRGLVQRGYNDEQIRGILGENALRVFEEVCG